MTVVTIVVRDRQLNVLSEAREIGMGCNLTQTKSFLVITPQDFDARASFSPSVLPNRFSKCFGRLGDISLRQRRPTTQGNGFHLETAVRCARLSCIIKRYIGRIVNKTEPGHSLFSAENIQMCVTYPQYPHDVITGGLKTLRDMPHLLRLECVILTRNTIVPKRQ
ncbi:hypothetical protein EVAR_17470_1 [Eumeta japonica]|uniref:Uncharacterized protein n=1 Tax=Eumeta variegata TaxID=151549 RepID=A0A4C1VBI0_EUMVA|nr:hypothetical protein EVAR_17470_1 [Eumeta japonica]